MKKAFVSVLIVTVIVLACSREKENRPDAKACPVIGSVGVPAVVKDSFAARYPSDTVITWFRKDSIGYCAYFMPSATQQTLVQFDNLGHFVKQTGETEEHNDSEDSTTAGTKGSAAACECEIPKD